MKKTLTRLLACVLILGCVFSLAGCVVSLGPINIVTGEYEKDFGTSVNTYKFGVFGKVTLTVDPPVLDPVSYEGKYKISGDGDEKEITFTFDDEDADIYEGTFDFSSGEEDGTKYIKIGMIKYTKAD